MPYSAETPLRIGLVGAGGIVKQRHLPALLAMPEVRITAVANSTPASTRAFCDEHVPGARAHDRWQEVAVSPEVDVVWIGTPPLLRCEATLLALANGKHVFCQARMARDLSEAGRMWEASLSYPELVAAICPAPHGMAGGELVKKLLAEGAIGRPAQVRLRSLSDSWLDGTKPAHWRQRVDLSGLQVLTLGIYVEVLHRWLGDITEVQADGAVVFPNRQGYEVEVPDFLNVLCTFRNGARGTLEFSGVAAHAPGDEVAIHGTEGTLIYDFVKDEVRLGRHGGEMKAVPIPPELHRTWKVEQDFINAILNPEAPRPRPDFIEGMRYMRVVQAVAVAQDTGERQRIC